MAKIKITKEISEYEGTVEEKVVTLFGTSAHINVGKKNAGKIFPVITPTKVEYKWVLSDLHLKQVVRECNRLLKADAGSFSYQKQKAVDNIQGRFTIGDLVKVIEILKLDNKNKSLIQDIKNTYEM